MVPVIPAVEAGFKEDSALSLLYTWLTDDIIHI